MRLTNAGSSMAAFAASWMYFSTEPGVPFGAVSADQGPVGSPTPTSLEQRGAALAPPSERHVRRLEVAGHHPPLEGQVADRPLPGRADAQLAGIGPRRRHELL